jgi:hypothetical protein
LWGPLIVCGRHTDPERLAGRCFAAHRLILRENSMERVVLEGVSPAAMAGPFNFGRAHMMNKIFSLCFVLVLAAAAPAFGCSSGSTGDDGNSDGNGAGGQGGGGTPSSGTPAPCNTDAQCPSGIRCVHLRDDAGQEGPGFCDITERTATPSGDDKAR